MTARYAARRDSFSIDGVYAIDDTSRVHATYAVTEERVTSFGLETNFQLFGRPSVIDLLYLPPSDTARAKMTVRNGKTRLTGFFSFANVKSDTYSNHSEQYELDTQLSGKENLNIFFDTNSKAASVKVSRKLDPKNKLDAMYVYANQSNRYAKLKLKHRYSDAQTFGLGTDYGGKKYSVEWEVRTNNGPWNFKASFPFDKSPKSGDLSIKRRFEF